MFGEGLINCEGGERTFCKFQGSKTLIMLNEGVNKWTSHGRHCIGCFQAMYIVYEETYSKFCIGEIRRIKFEENFFCHRVGLTLTNYHL